MTDSIFDGEDTLVGLVWIITEIAAINWATDHFFDLNLIAELGITDGTGATVVFAVIGAAGVIALLDSLGVYDAAELIDNVR